ncbi:50s ribosomal protein [Mycena olivaceomarginata]|nr:50s ribosomal protein [Mycena olivaceomarginata]
MILRSRLATSVGRPLNVAFRQQAHPRPPPPSNSTSPPPPSQSKVPSAKPPSPYSPSSSSKLPPAEPKLMMVSVEDPEIQQQRRMWGTTRTLISNAVTGMTEGFAVRLYLEGVGYRVAMEEDPRGTADGGNGRRLNMKLGYSHAVFVPIPPHIKAEVPAPTKIQLFCT